MPNDFEVAREKINNLVKQFFEEQTKRAKDLFWGYVDQTNGYTRDEFKKVFPEWCDAFDALPETDLFLRVNIKCLEISIDILKRALE